MSKPLHYNSNNVWVFQLDKVRVNNSYE